MTTPEEIATVLSGIKERAEKATKGPWTHTTRLSGSENHKGFDIRDNRHLWIGEVSPRDYDGKEGRHNADFIAASRTDIPALVAALEYVVINLDYSGKSLQLTRNALLDDIAAILKGQPK